jgi:fructose-bisphosphate aldolase class II
MRFVSTVELVRKAWRGGYAVPSFCVWNAESMKTVLDTAESLRSPVIIMNGWAEFLLLDQEATVAVAGALLGSRALPVALHLDHGQNPEQVKRGVAAGYVSVMLDYSTRPFEENVRALKEIADIARPLGVGVEGELGAIGRADAHSAEGAGLPEGFSTLTDPDDAVEFVRRTGVDLLAVSIGNAHGIYTKKPQFDFGLLERIRNAVDVPLVLHGGSGTPEEVLRRAISLGMAKVNVASELVQAVRGSLTEQWKEGRNYYTPIALADAMKVMGKVVERWIFLTGSAGKA